METETRDTTVSIAYCGTCNYRPLAASLALSIKEATGLASQLVHSTESGAFEVTFNGELLFSKKAAGQFPDHATIVDALKGRLGAPA